MQGQQSDSKEDRDMTKYAKDPWKGHIDQRVVGAFYMLEAM